MIIIIIIVVALFKSQGCLVAHKHSTDRGDCNSTVIRTNQMLVFEERGKPENLGKKLSEQSREPTNSTHIWCGILGSISGHIGGRQVHLPLCQPCSPNNYRKYNYFHDRNFFYNHKPLKCTYCK